VLAVLLDLVAEQGLAGLVLLLLAVHGLVCLARLVGVVRLVLVGGRREHGHAGHSEPDDRDKGDEQP
jgi:hypothetical protein